MLAPLAIGIGLLVSPQVPSDILLAALSYRRGIFERSYRPPEDSELRSAENFGAGSLAPPSCLYCFPAGSAEYEILIFFDFTSEGCLVFRTWKGANTTTTWALPLSGRQIKVPIKGTINRIVDSFYLKVDGQVTEEQRRILEAERPYVASSSFRNDSIPYGIEYRYLGRNGKQVGQSYISIPRQSSKTRQDDYSAILQLDYHPPILPAEAEYLGLRRQLPWYRRDRCTVTPSKGRVNKPVLPP